MKRHVMELVLKLSALHRLIISVLMGIVMALFCYEFVINPLLIAIFGWIGFAVVFLAFDWVRIFVRKPDQILKKARQDDGTAPFVFFLLFCYLRLPAQSRYSFSLHQKIRVYKIMCFTLSDRLFQ